MKLLLKAGILSLILIISACTSHRTETPMVMVPSEGAVIVSPMPAPRQVTVVPAGYTQCMYSRAGYYNNVWVPSHKICHYRRAPVPGKLTWIDGYWACSQYDVVGRCLYWDWRPSRWERTVVYY